MKFLLGQALVVAAVVIPSVALGWKDHGQIVMSDDAFKEALAGEETYGENNDENEFDLFGAHEANEDEHDWYNSLEEDDDRYNSKDWNFPKPPPSLKDGFPHPPPPPPHGWPPHGEPPRRDGPHGRPEWPVRPGSPRRKPGHPGKPDMRPPQCDCGPRPGWRFPHPPFHHPPVHRRPGGPGPFGCPHHKPIYTDKTIYEILSESKYTTKVFEIIKNDEELSKLFKETNQNITVFVPTDKAFEQLPPHHPPHNSTDALSKEFIKKAVLYHTSPDFYDTKKLFFSKTIPSGLESDGGIGKGNHQRLRISHHLFTGLRINMLSKIVAGNIFATNGIIHGIDHIIVLPPYAQNLVGILPTAFSTSALAFAKMELAGEHKIPEGPKTFFIPPNSAWKRLGYRINAFLFSSFGEKYLAALMKYHITHGKVVYSDFVLEPKKDEEATLKDGSHFHTELDTFLGDKKLTVDIWRKGPWTKWRINEREPLMLTDIITRDGVLHVPFHVIVPPHPKKPEAPKPDEPFRVLDEEYKEETVAEEYGQMTIEELKERLEPYL